MQAQQESSSTFRMLLMMLIGAALFGAGWAVGAGGLARPASANANEFELVPHPPTITANRQVLTETIREVVQQQFQAERQGSVGKANFYANNNDATRPGRHLQTIRSQLELFQTQHNGHFPTLAQLQDNWRVMTQQSDVNCNFTTKNAFGPYLQEAPVNPFNHCTKVAPTDAPAADCGWTYDQQTGAIRMIVPHDIAGQSVFGNADDFVSAPR